MTHRLHQDATGPLTLACIRTIWKHEVLLYRARIVHKRWTETIERPARTSDRHDVIGDALAQVRTARLCGNHQQAQKGMPWA